MYTPGNLLKTPQTSPTPLRPSLGIVLLLWDEWGTRCGRGMGKINIDYQKWNVWALSQTQVMWSVCLTLSYKHCTTLNTQSNQIHLIVRINYDISNATEGASFIDCFECIPTWLLNQDYIQLPFPKGALPMGMSQKNPTAYSEVLLMHWDVHTIRAFFCHARSTIMWNIKR